MSKERAISTLIYHYFTLQRMGFLLCDNNTQLDHDRSYRKIKEARFNLNLTSSGIDPLGLNLLHWATLCHQSNEEMIDLIQKENIDINDGTHFAEGIRIFNITPLHFAVQIENERLTQLLLEKSANPDIRRKYIDDYNIKLNNSPVYHIEEKTGVYALSHGSSIFKLFEKQFVKEYQEKRIKEHQSSILSCFAFFFQYSKEEKLEAARAFETVLNDTQKNADWLCRLILLKRIHPAINQGRLGKIYQASLSARRKELDTSTQFQLFL